MNKNDDILEELKRITKILCSIATKDMIQKEQIDLLSKLGFQPKEIAELLGTSSGTVSVALVDIRKHKKAKGTRKKKG